MRVAVLANPKSGRGQGAQVASGVLAALTRAGHDAVEVPFGAQTNNILTAEAQKADVVVLAGGDGTVFHSLGALVGGRAAVYHYPMGTENLFSREFGMVPDPGRLAAAVGRGLTREIDLGEAAFDAGSVTTFAMMVGFGPDAGVIRRLHAERRGPITHWSYLWPVCQELFSPCLPVLTVEADGKAVVAGVRGWLIVANMRQFALRIDPALCADPADGKLDAVFMPCSDGFGAAGWAMSARHRTHLSAARLVSLQASHIRVRAEYPEASVQADGELLDCRGPVIGATLRVAPRRLRVLLP